MAIPIYPGGIFFFLRRIVQVERSYSFLPYIHEQFPQSWPGRSVVMSMSLGVTWNGTSSRWLGILCLSFATFKIAVAQGVRAVRTARTATVTGVVTWGKWQVERLILDSDKLGVKICLVASKTDNFRQVKNAQISDPWRENITVHILCICYEGWKNIYIQRARTLGGVLGR